MVGRMERGGEKVTGGREMGKNGDARAKRNEERREKCKKGEGKTCIEWEEEE